MSAPMDILPPRDQEAEIGLLSALVTEPHRIDAFSQQLTGSDFFDPDHGQLFDALVLLRDSGKPISDITALVVSLRKMGFDAETWSLRRFAEIRLAAIPTNANWYAREVRRLSLLRKQQEVGLELLRRATDKRADPTDNAAWIDGQLQSLGTNSATDAKSIHEFALDVVAELAKPHHDRGVMSGLPVLDQMVGGMMGGELWTVGARPGQGKSAFATQVAYHIAQKGLRVLFCSIEMTGQELAQRTMCSLASIDQRRVRARTLNPAERLKLSDTANDLKGLPLLLWSPSRATMTDIRAAARLNHRVGGFGMMIVDYLQIITPRDPRMRRNEQIAEFTRELKQLAKEIDAPILCLAQLNREADNKEPTIGNLAESSAIEKDSDVVMFLHREAASDDTPIGRVKVIIDKHRHSERGFLHLDWIGHETRFVDPTEDKREASFDGWNDRD